MRRERLATNCSIRGVNCTTHFVRFGRLLTVHPATTPFRRAWLPFSRDSGGGRG